MRIDPISRSLINVVKLNGGDFREYLLRAMIYKMDKGVRTLNPELVSLLDEMESDFEKEYQEKIAVLADFRELIKNHKAGLMDITDPETIQKGDTCGYCARKLKPNQKGKPSCTCAEWRVRGPCYETPGDVIQ